MNGFQVGNSVSNKISSLPLPQYHKHLFVHIGDQPAHPLLESVEVKEIYDKFPQKAGGLKELYEKGPSNSFFLVKFWADLNTNIASDAGAFYGVSSQ